MSKRIQQRKATREVIAQLVDVQRNMKKEKTKNKNNYDSDDSASEYNEGNLLNLTKEQKSPSA